MDIKKIVIICLALSLLAYAQALEDSKPESHTATTISPLDIEKYESGTDIPKEPEHFTATTVSPLAKVPEIPEKTSEAAQPEELAESQEEPTKIEEIKEIYIDENGVKVDYDKNLYYCDNCDEEEGEDANNDNKKVIFSTSEEELTDNDSYEIEDGDDLAEDPLYDDEDVIDSLTGYDDEPLYDDIDEAALDDLMEYDEPLVDDVKLADEINEDIDEGSGFEMEI